MVRTFPGWQNVPLDADLRILYMHDSAKTNNKKQLRQTSYDTTFCTWLLGYIQCTKPHI